jgi:glycosyltransferase involved in cell wall biosynthesis
MRLMINTTSTFKGGGIQVAKSFIEECKKFSDNDYFVALSVPLSKTLDVSEFPNNFSFFKAPFRPATRVFKFKSHNSFLKKIEKEFSPDIVFTTSGPSYWKPKKPHLMGYNLPNYIYPESPYFKQISLKKKAWWIAMKLFAKYIFKRDADALVVQTEDVNKRVKKLLNKSNVYTVYNTINAHYLNQQTVENRLSEKTENEFRLLTLSAWYPHKNLSIIPAVIEQLKVEGYTNIKFVVTLPDVDFKKLTGDLEIQNIINIGPVKVEEAPSLYNECDAMFLPTLLECFSASYVEAMKMEKPIITSDMGFAHTICEDAAIYVDPINTKDIAGKIIKLYKSKDLQNRLIEKGLKKLKVFGNAEDRARHYLMLCEDLLKLGVVVK